MSDSWVWVLRIRCLLTRHLFRRSHLAYWSERGADITFPKGGYTLYVKCARCRITRETRKREWNTFRPWYEWWSHWDGPNRERAA